MGEMAGMGSEAPLEWQEFLVYLVLLAHLAFLVSASRPLAPCRLVSEHLAKGLISERLNITRLAAASALGEGAWQRTTLQSWGRGGMHYLQHDSRCPTTRVRALVLFN